MQFCLDHIAVGVRDVSAATPFLVGALGGEAYEAGPGQGFRFWQFRYADGGRLELLEPDGPPGGFLHRFLEARGPGVHHVTFKVDDIQAAMKRAAEAGYDVVGFNEDFPGWKEAFLHPKQAQGLVVQLAEEDASVQLPGEWSFPPAPEPGPAATLVGLRLAARDAGRARAQWEELLGAECRQEAGELRFHWPGSPLRVCVRILPETAEGPIAIEVTPARDGVLPPGRHPVLGTAFVLPGGETG